MQSDIAYYILCLYVHVVSVGHFRPIEYNLEKIMSIFNVIVWLEIKYCLVYDVS